MPIRMLAIAICLAATLLPARAALAQSDCPLGRAGYQVEDIAIRSEVNALEDGVIVQIDVRHPLDASVDAVIRYPYRAAVLPLRQDGTAVLSPAFVIPDRTGLVVTVSVVAVPKAATTESLNVIFSGFDTLVDAAADAAFKGRPLLQFLSGYIIGSISDEALAVLQSGRIVGQGSADASTLWMLGSISSPGGGFDLRVTTICS